MTLTEIEQNIGKRVSYRGWGQFATLTNKGRIIRTGGPINSKGKLVVVEQERPARKRELYAFLQPDRITLCE